MRKKHRKDYKAKVAIEALKGESTLELEPYKATVKRKAIATFKFYFFDMGIVRSVRRLPVISPESAAAVSKECRFTFPGRKSSLQTPALL